MIKMAGVFPGRYAAHTDQPFVVFLIGMSVNKVLAVRQWIPVLMAMGPMMEELNRHPEKGMLSSRVFFSPPALMLVQYWKSFEYLEAFARNPDDPHLPAWRRFNQMVGRSEIVGVYHETYLVQAGQYEAVYVNMPRFGLANAMEHVPATGQRATARRRLGGENEPAVPSADLTNEPA
jgi:hypothetical protein